MCVWVGVWVGVCACVRACVCDCVGVCVLARGSPLLPNRQPAAANRRTTRCTLGAAQVPRVAPSNCMVVKIEVRTA